VGAASGGGFRRLQGKMERDKRGVLKPNVGLVKILDEVGKKGFNSRKNGEWRVSLPFLEEGKKGLGKSLSRETGGG